MAEFTEQAPARELAALDDRPTVVVAVCTYQRNDQLRQLLQGLVVAADAARHLCRVGAVIVDDNPDQRAATVVADFLDQLEVGVHYRLAGRQNISEARNVALESSLRLSDWVAMTDDDCVPDREWLADLITSQRRTGADAISGRMIRRAPAGSPRWLIEQPFLHQGLTRFLTDNELSIASTHNSMVSSAWLREHPGIRFESRLGRFGGEDMLFFRTAHRCGLRITYSGTAVVYEDEPSERLRYAFLLRQAFWLGNSTFVTNIETGDASRSRMAVHGLAQLARAVAYPANQLIRRRPPQFRYALALLTGSVGTLLGVVGARVRHH